MKTALVTGVTGQNGAVWCGFLLGKGYVVRGIKRRSINTARLDRHFTDPDERDTASF